MANVAKLKKKAVEFEQKKQFDKALTVYVQILGELDEHVDEADVALYNRVGDLMLRQGNVSQAVDYYEKAVDLYSDGGFFNNAIALCNKILRNAPGRSSVYYKLGKISAKKGFVNDAKHNFLEYADRMQKADQLEEAFRALKEFADLCPDQDDIRLMLADQLVRKNRQGEAVEQLTTLYEKFQGEGRTREAQATVERIRAIDPEASIPEVTTGTSAAQKPRDLVFLEVSYDGPGANPDDYRHPSRGKRPERNDPPPLPGLVAFDPADLGADEEEMPASGHGVEPEMIPPLELEPMIADSDVEDAEPALEENPSSDLRFLDVDPDPTEPALEDVESASAEALDDRSADSHLTLSGLESNAVAGVPTPVSSADVVDADDESMSDDLHLVTGGDSLQLIYPENSEDVESAVSEGQSEEEEEAEIEDDWLSDKPSLSDLELDGDIGLDLPLLDLESDGAESPSLPTLLYSEPELGELDELAELDLLSDQMPGADVVKSDGGADPFAGDLDAQSVNWLEPLPLDASAASNGDVASVVDDSELGDAELPDLAGELELMELDEGPGDLSALGTAAIIDDVSWEPFAPEMSGRRLPEIADEGREDQAESLAPSPAPEVPLSPAERLRGALAGDDQNWELHKELAEALLEEGERAAGVFELELAMDGFEGAGDVDASRSVVDELLRIDPNSVRYHQKRVELAVRSGESALLVDAYLALADCFFRAGQLDKSRSVATRVLDLAPNDARARAALVSFGIPDRPTPPSVDAPSAPTRTRTPTPLSTAASAPTPPSVAARSLTPARPFPATPLPPLPPPAAATPPAGDDAYVNLGEWLREQDVPKSTRMTADVAEPTSAKQVEFDEMLTMFKQGVAANLEDADTESHYDLGVAYKEMGLLDEAIAEFQKALRGSERRVRTYEALGQCFVEKKQFQIAITILTRALNDRSATDDVLVGVLYLLGSASETLQHWTDALGFYRRVLSVDVDFRDTRARLAVVERKLA
ncbi:MAG: tetratricopeptide repeat protein [Gemmatimonadota bacterium]|nr:tetratricopeptide repeat protein [Gemmatimonadota bacterium]